MTRTMRGAAAGVALLLLATACGKEATGGEAVEEIRIGSIAPLTGNNSDYGTQWTNGVDMAVAEINEEGGIESLGGAQVVVEHADHASKPELGASETERLIESGVVALVGAIDSGVTLVSTQVAEQAQVPYIVPLSVSDEIMSRGFRYLFRTMEGVDLATQRSAEHLRAISDNVSPIETVAILHEDSLFGTGVGEGVEKHLKAEGFEVLARTPYSVDTADLTSELTQLKALNPDVLVLNSYYNDAQLILRTMQQIEFDVKGIYGTRSGALTDAKFLSEVGCIADYLFSSDNAVNLADPAAVEMYDRYQSEYGRPITVLSLDPYIAVKHVLKDALERAGSTDPEALREALAESEIDDAPKPGGPIVFDETGQNINAEPLTFQFHDGAIQNVWPEEYATADLVFPVPPIAERCG